MPPLDPKKDKDFLSATPEQQHAYLMSVDRDYARATPELQKQYLSSITGDAKKLSSPQILANANKPTPKFNEAERRAKYPSTKGIGSTIEREGIAGAATIAAPFAKIKELTDDPPDIPAAIKRTFTPQDEDEKKNVGDSTLGRAALPLYRGIVKPIRNATEFYAKAAKGKQPNAMTDALSVTPEAMGTAGASVVMPELAKVPFQIGKTINAATSPIAREQAANMVADAVTPNPKMRPAYVQNLMQHWDKVVAYAKDQQIPLDSVTNLRKAAQGASDTLQTHFQNIVEPYKDQINPHTGMKLGEMHKRLVSINNDLLPAYERGAGGVDPLQAVKAQEDLHAEADALRFHLYNDLNKASGIPRETLADVNQGSGALRNVGQKTELSESQLANTKARAGRNPVNVSPFSEKQFFINKGANAVLRKAGLTTDPDMLVKKAFSRTPSYDYSLPDLPNLPDPLAPKTHPVPSWKDDPAASGSPLPPAPSPEPYVSKQATKAKVATWRANLSAVRPFKRKALPPPSFIPLSDGLPSINE